MEKPGEYFPRTLRRDTEGACDRDATVAIQSQQLQSDDVRNMELHNEFNHELCKQKELTDSGRSRLSNAILLTTTYNADTRRAGLSRSSVEGICGVWSKGTSSNGRHETKLAKEKPTKSNHFVLRNPVQTLFQLGQSRITPIEMMMMKGAPYRAPSLGSTPRQLVCSRREARVTGNARTSTKRSEASNFK